MYLFYKYFRKHYIHRVIVKQISKILQILIYRYYLALLGKLKQNYSCILMLIFNNAIAPCFKIKNAHL